MFGLVAAVAVLESSAAPILVPVPSLPAFCCSSAPFATPRTGSASGAPVLPASVIGCVVLWASSQGELGRETAWAYAIHPMSTVDVFLFRFYSLIPGARGDVGLVALHGFVGGVLGLFWSTGAVVARSAVTGVGSAAHCVPMAASEGIAELSSSTKRVAFGVGVLSRVRVR